MLHSARRRARSSLAALSLATTLLAGCAVGPTIGGSGQYAVNTPEHYSENRVLFLAAPEEGTPVQRRRLLHAYELESDEAVEVQRLRPLGVIIRGVRLPADLEDRRDVAVILDVVTAGSESATSMVVFYQRDVPGGQMLNFQDLLVYYDPEWDGLTPPYFRVRVLEVNTERNARTRDFLEEANKLPASLGGIAPHPVLPLVKTAVEAAKLALGNRKNKVIVDYQVQFYSRAQIEGSGDSVLSPLRKGEWLVIGRERGATSEFWDEELQLDLRTSILRKVVQAENGENALETCEVPYVAVVVMSADAVVPKHIMDRSQALVDLLSTPTERTNFDGIVGAIESLKSAADAFRLERRLRKYMSPEDFTAVVDRLKQTPNNLEITQERALIRLVDDLVPDTKLDTVDLIREWWRNAHAGSMVEDKSTLAGHRWVLPNETWQGNEDS